MKLIFIYGAPSSGKLTVSKEIVERTPFRLFHNHHVIDLASSLVEFGDPGFVDLYNNLTLDVFRRCIEQGIPGLVFTSCYSHPEDQQFAMRVKDIIEDCGGEVCFVHLRCDLQELKSRVVSENRKDTQKLKDPDILEAEVNRWNFYTEIPEVNSLILNNTDISAEDTAIKITSHFKLETCT